jgi:hypothetical protein
MLLKEMVLMESKAQQGAAPAASPLLSSQSSDHFCVFRVSPLPHREITRGVLYIVGFRSIRIHEVQDCVQTTHEGQSGPHHGAKVVACVVGPNFRLAASPIDFFFSRSSISQKMTWQNVWICLTSRRS